MEEPSNGDPTTTLSLNDFPEHLLIDIISFLPTIDAIQTSSISRRWRNLWSFSPSLSFSYPLPPTYCPYEIHRRFTNKVNKTLILRHPQSPLQSFRLQFDFTVYGYSNLIELWIQHAVNCHAHNLDIDFFIDHEYHIDFYEEEPYFEFPFYVLRNGKVMVLKLSYCELILPLDMASGVKFNSIRSLFLDKIYLTDHMVFDLLNGCPNLELLSLRTCWGLENVKIRGMKIKKLLLGVFNCMEDTETSIEIDCPNLRMLDIYLYEVGKYTLKNLSSLVEAAIYFEHRSEYYGFWSTVVSSLGNVKKLTVQNWWFEKLMVPKENVSLKFHNLMWLELQTQYSKSQLLGMAALLELCPNLETLVLGYLFKINEAGESISEELSNKPINLTLPRLRQAKMKFFTRTENERRLLNLLMNQAKVCEKIVVVQVGCANRKHHPRVYRRINDCFWSCY